MDNQTTTDGSGFGTPGGALPPASTDYTVVKSVYASAIAMCIIAATAVVARFYTRGVILKATGVEDYCILVAFIFGVAVVVTLIKQVDYGLGSRFMELPPEIFKLQLRASWVALVFYQLSLTFSKFSVCLLYIRIFQYHYARIVAWCLFAIVAIYSIACFIATLLICIPIQAYWDFSITDRQCQTGTASLWAWTSLNIATDFLIFTVPIPVVWTMNLPRSQKLVVLLIFGLGFFVCIVSIIRLVLIHTVVGEGVKDPSHAYIDIAHWTSIEVFTSVVVACLIVLKPLISKFWPGFGRNSPNGDLEDQGTVLTIGGSGGKPPGSNTAAGRPPNTPVMSTASAIESPSLFEIESSIENSTPPRKLQVVEKTE